MSIGTRFVIMALAAVCGLAAIAPALGGCADESSRRAPSRSDTPAAGPDRTAPPSIDTPPPAAHPADTPAVPPPAADTAASGTGDSTAPSPAAAKAAIADRAARAIEALKTKDMAALAALAHPAKGVRFSPYPYVDSRGDLVFKPDELAGLAASGRQRLWGSYDGSGDDIKMTFAEYHKRFIFDHDYSKAAKVAYNGALLGNGNTINNIPEVYPGAIIVEYNFPGFDKAADGMDWKSLWLVFQKHAGEWCLVGVVHGEWTI